MLMFSRLESAGRFSTILRNLEIAMEQTCHSSPPAMDEGRGFGEKAVPTILNFLMFRRQILEDVSLSIPANLLCHH